MPEFSIGKLLARSTCASGIRIYLYNGMYVNQPYIIGWSIPQGHGILPYVEYEVFENLEKAVYAYVISIDNLSEGKPVDNYVFKAMLSEKIAIAGEVLHSSGYVETIHSFA